MPGDLNQLQRSPQDVARLQKAQQQLAQGRYALAQAGYHDLTGRYPLVAELWFEMGSTAMGGVNFDLAKQSFRRATELASRNPSLLVLIGRQYQNLRQMDDARDCFERAVAADPGWVDARISLAMWFEKERQLDKARAEVDSILAQSPRDDQARYFRAFLLHREKRYSEAETTLRDLIKSDPTYPYVKYASRHLLGVVLDELGQYSEAIRWLLEAKARVRQLTEVALLERDYDKADAQRRRLLASLTPEMIGRWQKELWPEVPVHRFVFLGGHPRSGTTLLEQILDAHPNVLAFDESLAFNQEVAGNFPLPTGSGESQVRTLDTLTVQRMLPVRQRYRQYLLHEVGGEFKPGVLLDKNPSLTVLLPLWLRAFPGLRVMIALRDPRDVVLSCFFQNLVLNATNMNFLSLERTAKHYSDLMGVWLRMRELGGFDWREIRYEDVVENPEAEGHKATEFAGLSWHPDQGRYYETARRKFLFAPTYHDVRQPVYRRAVGRWKHYAEALEPIQAKLAPYCQAFGYPV